MLPDNSLDAKSNPRNFLIFLKAVMYACNVNKYNR
jgi:hypothetical protein